MDLQMEQPGYLNLSFHPLSPLEELLQVWLLGTQFSWSGHSRIGDHWIHNCIAIFLIHKLNHLFDILQKIKVGMDGSKSTVVLC